MTEMPERDWLALAKQYRATAWPLMENDPPEQAEAQALEIVFGPLLLAAEAERDAARQLNAAYEVAQKLDDNDFATLRAQVAALEAEREALAHAVLRYGWHDTDCPFLQDELPCTCDLEAAEAAARALLSPEAP